MNTKSYNYIVIGGGSAGSIAAAELAKNTDVAVLLIDAGTSPDDIADVWDPYDNNNLYGMKDIWWRGYKTPKYSGSSTMVGVPRSKLFGGCTAVNDMVFTRGAPADFDLWVNVYGCTGWSYNDVASAFDRIQEGLAPTTGPKDEFGAAFVTACEDMGLKFVPDYNAGLPLDGVSPLCSTISSSTVRETSYRTYTDDGNESNLTFVGGALVNKIIFKNDCAVGVEYSVGDAIYEVYCNGEIILSAGAINSPKILMLSGIGEKAQLDKFGIPVIVDSPSVGKNLQDAIIFSLNWSTSSPLNVPPDAPNGNRRNEGYAITWTNLNDEQQPQTCIEMMPGLYEPHQSHSTLVNNYSITGGAMRLKSRGWVNLASADPTVPPEININLFENPDDMELAFESFEIARSIGNSQALSSLRKEETTPGSSISTPEQIKKWLLENSMSYSHPSCTCKMGPSGTDSVVDCTLKVYGVKNLRVADTSIMPEITSGHTQAPAFMIGQRVADFIIAGE
ncbi:MAG: GMC family oxidoreductase N-terminal domain-containing protein [Rhodospirillales bacterium]|nr:GMC family oxidoreductase N-terminal domain-containing protein [Rhodospirillales bacterium]